VEDSSTAPAAEGRIIERVVKSLKNKVAIVTGGSRLAGWRYAETLAH
jgi:hypothetical protein